MIKITVNSVFSRLALLLFSLFGLAACAPIVLPRFPIQLPQSYPVQPPVSMPAQRPQPVAQNTPQNRRAVPTAGALISAPVKAARAPVRAVQPPKQVQQRVQPPPRVAQARPAQYQARQVTVPPTLNPVQQARVSQAGQRQISRKQSYSYRPSASVGRASAPAKQSRQPIWEDIPQQVKPVQKKTVVIQRPSAAVRRKPAPVAKPAPRVVQTKPAQTVRAQTTQAAQTEVEVLDLSAGLTKKATSPEKQAASTSVSAQSQNYSSSPAVAILTKQANNQLTVGKAGRAAATLERALRIEPENPLLWLRLAEVNAQQGKKSQAASMARKALNLAPDDAGLQARGKRLLN